jgi:glutathionyl-hydroquinone reductase
VGYLLDGHWVDKEQFPSDASGRPLQPDPDFLRSEPLDREVGRYHLYLAHACPWCQQVAIALHLKGLRDTVSVSFVHPVLRQGGWRFAEGYADPLFGAQHVSELYTRSAPRFTGRVTVPVLWDRRDDSLVCNSSEDLIRLFDVLGDGPELYPERGRPEIRALNAIVSSAVNNGVYRCGFARSQEAYDQAFAKLFSTLDVLSARLAHRPWLVGDTLTEVDIRLFVTLVRFDAVYVGHFKCNRNRIADDRVLQSWLERLYALPAFRETTRLDEIKEHYYASHLGLNPSGIIPSGPHLPWAV